MAGEWHQRLLPRPAPPPSMTARFHTAVFALAPFVAGFVFAPSLHISFHGYAHSHGGHTHYHAADHADPNAAPSDDAGSPERSKGREPFDPDHGKGSVIHSAAAGLAAGPAPAVVADTAIVAFAPATGAAVPYEHSPAGAHLVRGPPACA